MNKFSYISGGSRDGYNCNLYTKRSKSHKEFYYLGAKCWNIIPHALRNLDNVNTFSKTFKAQLLYSAVNDENYSINNTFDYLYKPVTSYSTDYDFNGMPREIIELIESIQATNT